MCKIHVIFFVLVKLVLLQFTHICRKLVSSQFRRFLRGEKKICHVENLSCVKFMLFFSL